MPPSVYETVTAFKHQSRHYTHFSPQRSDQLYAEQGLAASRWGKCVQTPKIEARVDEVGLNVLWERFMLIAKERGSAGSMGVSAARAIIAEMHEADQKSDWFR
jgi:hypothetical protein